MFNFTRDIAQNFPRFFQLRKTAEENFSEGIFVNIFKFTHSCVTCSSNIICMWAKTCFNFNPWFMVPMHYARFSAVQPLKIVLKLVENSRFKILLHISWWYLRKTWKFSFVLFFKEFQIFSWTSLEKLWKCS